MWYVSFLSNILIFYKLYQCSNYFLQVPGRMGMIVTLYLISANVYNSVDAPKVRGFSYVEIWMLGSQFPILLALFEYGFVLYFKKIAKKVDEQKNMMSLDDEFVRAKPDLDEQIKKLDFATMIFSFVFFVLFAILYWTILLS